MTFWATTKTTAPSTVSPSAGQCTRRRSSSAISRRLIQPANSTGSAGPFAPELATISSTAAIQAVGGGRSIRIEQLDRDRDAP